MKEGKCLETYEQMGGLCNTVFLIHESCIFYFYYTNYSTINIIKVYVKTIYNLYSMLCHDDMKMSKHAGVQIIRRCDIYFYINFAFVITKIKNYKMGG